MSDEDRMQLMLLVKEGKISVQEAVDTVCLYYAEIISLLIKKSFFNICTNLQAAQWHNFEFFLFCKNLF